MKTRPEFLLEKLVHYAVRDEGARARGLMMEAAATGMQATALLAEIVLPAVECVHQLRRDNLIGARVFNAAIRGLSGVLHMLKGMMQEEMGARRGRVMVLSAPLEETDLGAQIVAALAEGYGFEVQFAGAHLEMEELLFACSRLEPEFVVIHGSLGVSRGRVKGLIERLRSGHVE